jgi:hypothetical protein
MYQTFIVLKKHKISQQWWGEPLKLNSQHFKKNQNIPSTNVQKHPMLKPFKCSDVGSSVIGASN